MSFPEMLESMDYLTSLGWKNHSLTRLFTKEGVGRKDMQNAKTFLSQQSCGLAGL